MKLWEEEQEKIEADKLKRVKEEQEKRNEERRKERILGEDILYRRYKTMQWLTFAIFIFCFVNFVNAMIDDYKMRVKIILLLGSVFSFIFHYNYNKKLQSREKDLLKK